MLTLTIFLACLVWWFVSIFLLNTNIAFSFLGTFIISIITLTIWVLIDIKYIGIKQAIKRNLYRFAFNK